MATAIEKATKPRSELCYKSTLKSEYGLTDSWILRLGEPEKIVRNPHYSSGPPSKLYSRQAAELLIEENFEDWKKLQVKRQKLSDAQTEFHAERRQQKRERFNGIPLDIVRVPPFAELVAATRRFGIVRYGRSFVLSENAIIAFVRHNLTNYEPKLAAMRSLYADEQDWSLYETIKMEVNIAVEDAIPWPDGDEDDWT